MHIAVISHYFAPEAGAPSARLFEMAKNWAERDCAVTVITNLPNHPTGEIHEGYRGKGFMSEEMRGIRVVRCATYATPNSGIMKKTLAHLYFMCMAVWQGGPEIRGADVIVVSSPTLFSVISAWWLGWRMNIPYVFEVRDLWPGIFVELGILKNRLIIRLLEALEMFLYRKAARVVTVTRSFSEDISRRGIDPYRIHFIPNGVDLERYMPGGKDAKLLARLGLEGKFIALYCGAHGISHSLQRIVDAAEMLKGSHDVHFLFVGDGAEREKLVSHASSLGLSNITFLPSQPKSDIPLYYNSADVCLVPLRNIPLFKTFIPSKMFEIMGCAKPIVASLEGESAEILRRAGAAIIAQPENSRQIADGILKLKADPALGAHLGAAGRAFVVSNFDRAKLAREYLDVLSTVLK